MADGVDDLLEGLDNLALITCKEHIVQLQAERERRRELTERLQEKLKALNNELAARKEEADRSKNDLLEEQARNRRLAEQRREQEGPGKDTHAIQDEAARENASELQVSNVRRFIERHLQENIERGITKNELGIRVFDEVELMVEKSAEEQAKEATYIDTVLVTYSVPNTELKYNLSFRVDRLMLSKKLREDACLYFGLSEVEFILKTMSNAKVHDDLMIQNCFRPNEEAHFILVQKTPKNIALMEKELSHIRPLVGKKARAKVPNKVNDAFAGEGVVTGAGAELAEQMSVVPGLHKFMTLRDGDVKRHLEELSLRNICIYWALTILTVAIVYILLPPPDGYVCRAGMTDLLAGQKGEPGSFSSIRSRNETWDWLQSTLPEQLLTEGSDLRQNNYMTGYLQIRLQKVQPNSSETCPSQDDRDRPLPAGVSCFEAVYNSDTAEKGQLDSIEAYWYGKSGLDGRNVGRTPYTFVSRQDAPAGFYEARSDNYVFDSSGYSAEYNMQWEPLQDVKQAFLEDLAFLRRMDWIDIQTRAVHVNFMAYNGNYDLWVSNRYTIEMNAFGLVVPRIDVSTFKPVMVDFRVDLDIIAIDMTRMVLTLYVFLFQVPAGFLRAKRETENGFRYFSSGAGLSDVIITGLFLSAFITRYTYFSVLRVPSLDYLVDSLNDFVDSGELTRRYFEHMSVEAALLCVLLQRSCFFLRVNRQIFLIWTTVARAWASTARVVSFIFLPVFFGLVVLGMAITGAYYDMERDFWSALTHRLMQFFGNTRDVLDPSRDFEVAYYVSLYVVLRLWFINGWIAILIYVYQQTRVEAGYLPRSYRWKEYNYAKWCLPWPILKVYLRFLRPNIEKPQEASADDDE